MNIARIAKAFLRSPTDLLLQMRERGYRVAYRRKRPNLRQKIQKIARATGLTELEVLWAAVKGLDGLDVRSIIDEARTTGELAEIQPAKRWNRAHYKNEMAQRGTLKGGTRARQTGERDRPV